MSIPATARTAISRKYPSAPMRWLSSLELLRGRTLDYGCGRGDDAACFGLECFDPHFSPARPTGKFDTITCIYVLNVLTRAERAAVVAAVLGLLSPRGVAYFVVRRDKFNTKGQYRVKLKAPVFYERKGAFAVYRIKKEKA